MRSLAPIGGTTGPRRDDLTLIHEGRQRLASRAEAASVRFAGSSETIRCTARATSQLCRTELANRRVTPTLRET